MKTRILVLLGILCVATAAWAGEGSVTSPIPPAGKGGIGFGFEPGLVPGKDFVPGQLIVGFREGMSTQAILGAAVSRQGRLVKDLGDRAVLLEFGSEADVLAAVNQLLAIPGVLFVERNGFMRIPPQPKLPAGLKQKEGVGASTSEVGVSSVSADRATGSQWHLTVIRKTAPLPVLSLTPPTVAVIDTGIDYTHSDLAGKVYLGFNAVANTFDPADDNGHGTHVAGIIAARAGNVFFGEGVCPNCKLLAVKVLDQTGSGSFADVAQGMAYVIAVRNSTVPPTRVVNMSLGGGNSSLVAAQVAAMRTAGMVLVAAAGNENTSVTPSYPGADVNTALRVMATETNDSRAWFSNFSPSAIPTRYNIAAPGWNIWSTLPGEGFGKLSGTSMASPVVAGAAALVWGQLPLLTRDQMVTRLVTMGKLISKGFAASTRRVDVHKAILTTSETGVVGRILDPFTGLPHSPATSPDTVRLYNGATFLFSDLTNKGGSYEITNATLTAGARAIKGLRPAAGSTPALPEARLRNVTISAGLVAGPFTDAKPRARAAGYASITVDWLTTQPIVDTTGCIDACNGWDLDLMVRLPSGSYIDFFTTGDLRVAPFVIHPRDSFDDLEPLEAIVIAPSAANGLYKVFVDNPFVVPSSALNPSWTGSLASAQVYTGATLFRDFAAAPATCGANRYWHLGNLTKTGAAYAFTLVNACTNIKP